MVSLILPATEFAGFYRIIATIVVLIAIFDVFNAKYMVSILAGDSSRFDEIVQARFFLAILSSLAAFAVAHLYGFDGIVSGLSGLLTGLMLCNSGFLTLFYCTPGRQNQIVFSSGLGLATMLGFLFIGRNQAFSIHTGLTALVLYKMTELIWLGGFVEKFRHFRDFRSRNKSVFSALRLFPRIAFYVQNILSVLSGRLHAFVLPLILIPAEFGVLSAAVTLMAVYIFFLTFLGTEFFRDTSAVGLKNARWHPYVARVLVTLTLYLLVIFTVIPVFYPQLRSFLPFMVALAIVLTISSQQGYILFLLGLDRWIIILSAATLMVSLFFLYIIPNAYELNGAFLAMIATELASTIMAAAILIVARTLR